MPARELILERFSSLSPTLQVAARFAVDHPNEVVILSMRALAERAQVQPATFVRLAQSLGYSGWPELKSAFAESLGLHAERYGTRARSLTTRGEGADLLGEMFAVQRNNLDQAEAQCGEHLRDAARLLHGAAAVYVAGFRASFPIAYSLVYGYRLFRDTVHLVDGQMGGLEMQLRPIGPGDAVLAISFAPYSKEALQVLEAARAAGARVVALTDSDASPLALAADVAVLFPITSPSFFPSIGAGMALSESLLELLLVEGGATAAKRVDQVEKHLFGSGAYVDAPRARRTASGA